MGAAKRRSPLAGAHLAALACAGVVGLTGNPAVAQPGPVPPGAEPAPPPAEPAPPPAEPAPPPDAPPAPEEPAPPPETAPTATAAPSQPSAAPALAPPPPPPPPSDEAAGTELRQRFILDTGRTPLAEPKAGEMSAQIHGEYQLRLTKLTDTPLRQFRFDRSTASLGQDTRVTHWLRVTPRFHFGKTLELVGQIDVPYGFIAGQETQLVDSATEPYAERDGLRVAPRWLYLAWQSPVGVLRVGQQPSHWGLGIVANDGDRPSLFGDYARGSIVERVLFATKPAGRDSKVTVALAGDIVFADRTADLRDDEKAYQGVLAAFWRDRDPDPYRDVAANMVGVYGVVRHQSQEARTTGLPAAASEKFDETLDVFALDSAGEFHAKIPGTRGHVHGGYEVAYIFGETDIFRTTEQTRANEREKVRALGAVLQLGFTTTAGSGDDRWGDLSVGVEWGWASGDANPNDGTTRRFTMDPNHNVGLVLFDEVLAWKTARAANIARDPDLTNRPNPGLQLLPSDGGIFGATYVYPTVVVRPVPELDLKAAAVLAQTTADFVDPVQTTTTGRFANYDGGDPRGHDLGLELDAGAEYRLSLGGGTTLQLGAQGGVLFPGSAFDGVSPSGARTELGTQWIGVGRLGLQY